MLYMMVGPCTKIMYQNPFGIEKQHSQQHEVSIFSVAVCCKDEGNEADTTKCRTTALGKEYTGSLSTTKGGKTCRKWSRWVMPSR